MSRRVAHAAIRESSPPAPSWETSFPGTKALRGAFPSWMEAASPDGRPLRRSRKRRAEKPPRSPKRRPLFLQEGDGGAKGPKATAALQVDLLRGGCPAGRLLPVCSRVAEVEIGEEQGEPPAVLWLPPLSPPLYFEHQSGKEGGTPRACVAREREREEEEEKKVRLKKKSLLLIRLLTLRGAHKVAGENAASVSPSPSVARLCQSLVPASSLLVSPASSLEFSCLPALCCFKALGVFWKRKGKQSLCSSRSACAGKPGAPLSLSSGEAEVEASQGRERRRRRREAAREALASETPPCECVCLSLAAWLHRIVWMCCGVAGQLRHT